MLTDTNISNESFEQYLKTLESEWKDNNYIHNIKLENYSLSEIEIGFLDKLIKQYKKFYFGSISFDPTRINLVGVKALAEICNIVENSNFYVALMHSENWVFNKQLEPDIKEKLETFSQGSPNIGWKIDVLLDGQSALWSVPEVLKTYSLITKIHLSFNRRTKAEVIDVSLFTKFIAEISELQQISSLTFDYYMLEGLEQECLKESIKRLIEMPSLQELILPLNGVGKLGPAALKEMAKCAERNKNLQNLTLFIEREITKGETDQWSEKDKREFYITQMLLESKKQYINCRSIFLFPPSEEEIKRVMLEFIENYPNRMPEIHDLQIHYPCIRDLNIVCRKIISDLESLATNSLTTNYLIEFTELLPNKEVEERLNKALTKKRNVLRELLIIIQLRTQSPEQLEGLAQLINTLPLPAASTLCLLENYPEQHGTDRLNYFIEKVDNSSIQGCDLKNNKLGALKSGVFLTLVKNIIKKKRFVSIDLSSNALSLLGKEIILEALQLCEHDLTLLKIKLYGNNFYTLGGDFFAQLSQRYSRISLSLFYSLGAAVSANNDILVFYKKLAPEFKLEFAKLYYQEILLQAYAFSFEEILDLEVTPEQRYEVVKASMPIVNVQYPWVFENHLRSIVLEKVKLDSKHILSILKDCIRLGLENEGLELVFDKFPLDPNDKVELFLFACQYSWLHINLIEDLELYRIEHAASKILSSFTEAFANKKPHALDQKNEELVDEIEPGSTSTNIEIEADENDADDTEPEQFINCFPKLEAACIEIWPHAESFVTLCSQSLKNYKENGEEVSLALVNMIGWFAWTCTWLITKQNLIENIAHAQEGRAVKSEKQVVTNKKQRRSFISTFNHVLKEILNLANPQMRYTLTTIFFEKICQDNEKYYFSLMENYSTNALLFAIPLCQILLQVDEEATKMQCSQIIEKLIASIPYRQYAGRHGRTLLAGLLAISEDNAVNPIEALKCFETIFAKPRTQQDVEAKLEDFINICTTEKDSGIRKRKLNDIIRTLNAMNMPLLMGQLALEQHIPEACLSRKAARTLARSLIDNIVSIFYKGHSFKQQISHLIMLQGLVKLGKLSEMVALDQNDFHAKAREIFQQLFDLEEEQFNFYNNTFSTRPNQSGLLTYFAKIRTLKTSEGTALIELFKRFVQTVLSQDSQDFYKMRYDNALNRHLAAIFTENDQLELLWKKGDKKDFQTFMKENDITLKEFVPDFHGFVRKKIFGHKHLDPQYYSALEKYLNARNEEAKNEAKEAAQALLNILKSKADISKDKSPSNPLLQHAIVQRQLISLLETPLNAQEKISKRYGAYIKILRGIQNALIKLRPSSVFERDVESMLRGLKNCSKVPKAQDWQGWSIVDTDDYWDLFMAGTDVEGSCQSIDGNLYYNKCLMAYVMDGKNRMLAIRNAEGRIIARCILRILIANKTSNDDHNATTMSDTTELTKLRPVLFMEEIYPDTVRRDLKEALEQFAVARAKALSLPLLSLEGTSDSCVYKYPVESLESSAPWEYVDALYGIQNNGVFTIKEAQIIYDPDLDYKISLIKEAFKIAKNLEKNKNLIHSSNPVDTNEAENRQPGMHIAWHTWQADYKKQYPNREQNGYGPGALVIRPSA